MEKKNLRSTLVVAAEKGCAADVVKLLEVYAKLPSKKQEFYFALYIAALNGHEDVVQILLNKGADPNFCFENYLPPLHAAAIKGNGIIIQLLLNHGAKVNPKLKIKSGKKFREVDYFSSPLLMAVRNKHVAAAKFLLQKGADINIKLQSSPVKENTISDEFERRFIFGVYWYSALSSDSLSGELGYSPLHFAVRYRNEDLVNLLLKFGADVDSKSEINTTPLAVALVENHASIIDILLKAGADTKVEVDGSPLLYHILYQQFHYGLGDYDGYKKKEDIDKKTSFRLLLKLGADPCGWSKKEKETVLHFAAGNGEVHAVHLLLKYGADMNALDGKGKPPFHYAVSALQEVLEKIQDQYYSSIQYSDSDCDSDYDFWGVRRFDDSSEDEDEREERQREREERQREREEERQKEYEKRKKYNLSSKKYVYNVYQYRYDCDHDEGFSVFQDPEPFRIIAQRMARELTKLEASGKTIVKENVDILKSAFVKTYYAKSKSEINKMKKTVVSENPKVTFFDILMADESKLEELGNKNILASAKNVNYEKLFPNYASNLENCLKKGLKRKRPGDESHGSSDEEEAIASVQKRFKSRRRARFGRRDVCVIS